MENTITKDEAMGALINNFPMYREAAAIYGHSLFQVVDAYQIEQTFATLNEYQADSICMLLAANGISEAMNKHLMFKINVNNDNAIEYEGFDCYNRSCGMFTHEEAVACALIMVHGNLGMFHLTQEDGMLISAFKYSDPKFAQILD